MSVHKKFQVFVIGGGPTGLVSALTLSDAGFDVTLVERRIEKRNQDGVWVWQAGIEQLLPDGRSVRLRRREQVVTIQDSVLASLPENLRACFNGEKMWANSQNVAICEIEDRLLNLANERTNLTIMRPPPDCLDELDRPVASRIASWVRELDADLIIAADGANSLVRASFESKFCPIKLGSTDPDNLVETDHTLGVALTRLEGAQPQNPALSTCITLAQLMFLFNGQLNGSVHGYLNIRMTQNAVEQLIEANNGHSCHFAAPFQLNQVFERIPNALQGAAPEACALIKEGLHLFNFTDDHVQGIVHVPITPTYASKFFALRGSENQAVVLIGDAAMSHHFWPGRGLNTGIKSAMALCRTVLDIRRGFPLAQVLLRYDNYMQVLRLREMQGRSASMLRKENQLRPEVDNAEFLVENPSAVRTEQQVQGETYRASVADLALVGNIKGWRNTVESLPGWPHSRLSDDAIIRKMLDDRSLRRPTSGGTMAMCMAMENVLDDTLAGRGWPINQQRGFQLPNQADRFIEDPPIDECWSPDGSGGGHRCLTELFQVLPFSPEAQTSLAGRILFQILNDEAAALANDADWNRIGECIEVFENLPHTQLNLHATPSELFSSMYLEQQLVTLELDSLRLAKFARMMNALLRGPDASFATYLMDMGVPRALVIMMRNETMEDTRAICMHLLVMILKSSQSPIRDSVLQKEYIQESIVVFGLNKFFANTFIRTGCAKLAREIAHLRPSCLLQLHTLFLSAIKRLVEAPTGQADRETIFNLLYPLVENIPLDSFEEQARTTMLDSFRVLNTAMHDATKVLGTPPLVVDTSFIEFYARLAHLMGQQNLVAEWLTSQCQSHTIRASSAGMEAGNFVKLFFDDVELTGRATSRGVNIFEVALPRTRFFENTSVQSFDSHGSSQDSASASQYLTTLVSTNKLVAVVVKDEATSNATGELRETAGLGTLGYRESFAAFIFRGTFLERGRGQGRTESAEAFARVMLPTQEDHIHPNLLVAVRLLLDAPNNLTPELTQSLRSLEFGLRVALMSD